MTTTPITVLIVDDQTVIRERLQQQLIRAQGIVVVGEADSGEAALAYCDELQPDVVLMDVVMPGLDGFTITQIIRRKYPDTHVLIVADFEEMALIPIALRAGASGYLDRSASPAEMIEAIRATAVGLSILSPQAAAVFLRQQDSSAAHDSGHCSVTPGTHQTRAASHRAARDPHASEIERYCSLTHRERQVLSFVLQGFTSAEIGTRLFISPRTVEKHRANMMGKLRVRNQYELTRLAYNIGVMPVGDEDMSHHSPLDVEWPLSLVEDHPNGQAKKEHPLLLQLVKSKAAT